MPADIPFEDVKRGQSELARILQRVSPGLAAAVPALLVCSPDPDSAVLLFHRLLTESSPEITSLLDQQPVLAHYAIIVFGHSRFLAETLLQNTDLLPYLGRESKLDRSLSRDEFWQNLARFRARSPETDTAQLLAQFKKREYIRIMLRDVLQIAPLAETTNELSALADVLIQEALQNATVKLRERYGATQHLDMAGRLADTPFAILSMGKLGGNELNYSSDIDLLYIFGDGEEPASAAIPNREYFIRLAQEVTDTLSRLTPDGPVFRIDLRLRPQGTQGEIAISLKQAVGYYESAAHDWERQALIKARYSAGSAPLAREFLEAVRSRIYTEHINFAAVRTAWEAREKMHRRRGVSLASSGGGDRVNVKLDSGGLRDIEFLVQCLQRMYGGSEPWLRSSGTLFSLQKLHDKQHISGGEFHRLTRAYEFLRRVEHCLQLRRGQQTHRLPSPGPEWRVLERFMEAYSPSRYRTENLLTLIQTQMAEVAEIYRHVVYKEQDLDQTDLAGEAFGLRGGLKLTATPETERLTLSRLASDSPLLFAIASRDNLEPQTRRNLLRFLNSAFTSPDRYATLLRHPQAVELALGLFGVSDYLTDVLVRHPQEIATLTELNKVPDRRGTGYLFDSPLTAGRISADPVCEYLASSPGERADKLGLLRSYYRHRLFAIGARDILLPRDVHESLAAYTATTDDAIAAAFQMSGNPEGLTLMAVGRLGSCEFDVLSDADLLFVCHTRGDRERLTKAAELVMHALAAYTREGMICPVDVRLRPRGAEGELLATPYQLEEYFERQADPWEALMYTKLRFLAGSRSLSDQAFASTRLLFDRFAADHSFARAVREMRTKLETAETGAHNLKTSSGGVYDIDFLVGFLLLKHQVGSKGGTLRDRIWRCEEAGCLSKVDAATLDHAGELFRTVEHVLRLVAGRPLKWLPPANRARQAAEKLTADILQCKTTEGLEAELFETRRRVRAVYERVLNAYT